MKTILNIETFNGKIKIKTNGKIEWIPMKNTEASEEEVAVIIKEVDGTEPLGPNKRWIGIEEFIKKMGNSKVVNVVLKEFIRMGYTIKMEEPKNIKIS